MVWTLLIAASLHASAPAPRAAADSTPTCAQDLEALDGKLQADYGGFRLEPNTG